MQTRSLRPRPAWAVMGARIGESEVRAGQSKWDRPASSGMGAPGARKVGLEAPPGGGC